MIDHACLGCGQVHADAREVTLRDGTVVSNYSEAWRHEAEAIAVLNLPTKNERWSFMSQIKRVRGQEAHDALYALVIKIHAHRKAQLTAA